MDGMACHADRFGPTCRFMAARHGCHGDEITLPANAALQGLADGLAEAWRCYGNKEYVLKQLGKRSQTSELRPVMLD